LLAFEKIVKGLTEPPEFVKVPMHEANNKSDMKILVKTLTGKTVECEVN
jgi:hypothetical protein